MSGSPHPPVPPSDPRPVPGAPRPTARRRRSMLAVVAVVVLAAVVPLAQSASAERPRCDDGSYPPCAGDPDPEPPPPPPPATWRVNVLPLVQPGAAPLGSVAADRSWRTYPVLEQASVAKGAEAGGADGGVIPGPVVNLPSTVTPAGSATMVGTALDFPVIALPASSTMEMRLRESGAPGSLCRIAGIAPLPASGRPLHLLVPASITRGGADLNAMVASFVGPQTGLPPGAAMTITATTLTPQSNGLMLGITGTFSYGPLQFALDYHLLLTIDPSNSANPGSVLVVNAPAPGTVGLTWISTPPANGDSILEQFRAGLDGQLRPAVLAKAGPLVNQTVLGLHDVRWWTEQGFTLSVRRVSYSSAGLKVDPALCRLS